ncbi:hypothetical protein C8J57DRAFT_1456967 [Mycena rebaudengoi]|nr:hypothetical protein C8J57DRAFT_1456967 [Mycena rebaudengoi]
MAQTYELNVKSISGIDLKYRNQNLYVAIDVDGKRVHTTHPKKDSVAMWNDTSTLVLHDKYLARAEIEIDVAVSLDYVKSKGMQGPTLLVTLTTRGHIQSGETEIANAQADIVSLGCETSGFAELEVAGAVQNSDFVSVLGTLIKSIVKIGDEFAKIHPYANVAWMALTSVYKAVQNQQQKDEKVVQLVQTMAELYSFAKDADSLSEAKKHLEDTVTKIVQLTARCAMFIREYTVLKRSIRQSRVTGGAVDCQLWCLSRITPRTVE